MTAAAIADTGAIRLVWNSISAARRQTYALYAAIDVAKEIAGPDFDGWDAYVSPAAVLAQIVEEHAAREWAGINDDTAHWATPKAFDALVMETWRREYPMQAVAFDEALKVTA